MRVLLIGFLIACAIQHAVLQAPGDDISITECIMNAAEELGLDTIAGGVEWMIELRQTIDYLLNGRRRCLEMTNQRLQDACMLAWRAQAIFEAARITNDLRGFVGDEASQQFFNDFLNCFGVEPNPDEVPSK